MLREEDLIISWQIIFGQRSVQNNIFYKFLLEDLLADKIDLIQVSQMLLIRSGDYSSVGVYYDASSSAYQIIILINNQYSLCALTNVYKPVELSISQPRGDM